MRKRTIEVLYSKKALEQIKKEKLNWWIIHSDEHPSGKKHIGYIKVVGKSKLIKLDDVLSLLTKKNQEKWVIEKSDGDWVHSVDIWESCDNLKKLIKELKCKEEVFGK